MAVIGDQLSVPETGWRRYDDTNEVIVYTGTWGTETLAGNYNGSAKYTSTSGSTMSFTFYGTKLRIIGGLYSGRTTTAQVIIDGAVVGTINEDSATSRTKTLVFEISGLSKGKHAVQIKVMDTKVLLLDAIDVDGDGYLTRAIGTALTTPDVGWQRYDNTYSYINYVGSNWRHSSTTSRGLYKDTISYVDYPSHDNFIRINFIGTSIRIMSTLYTENTDQLSIEIDGKETVVSTKNGASSLSGSILTFEAIGLSDGLHVVTLKSKDGKRLSLDAIDINETGRFVAQIGQQLTAPESGWRRYDDSSSFFSKFSFVNTSNASQWYGGSYSVLNTPFPYNGSFNRYSFLFTGKKIRIISSISKYRSNNIKLIIDGEEYRYDSGNTSEASYQMLVFEKIDLDDKEHFLIIEADGNTAKRNYDNMIGIEVDAIDIDSTGRIFHPDEVTNISELTIGKRIRCNYVVATSGKSGVFGSLGKEISSMVSTPTNIPNVDFYFIVVDEYNGKKVLIADRNIQTSISWDALNSEGLIFGVQKNLNDSRFKFVLRAMSGGINASDNDNEWDKYIVNSTLGGKITAGDNSVWNWSGATSLTSTSNVNSANRIRRGNSSVSSFEATASNGSNIYRPVLEIEALPMNRSFIKYEGSYKKYLPKTYIESGDNAIPVVTSNTAPSGVASASSINSTSFDAYQAFNGIQDERYAWASNSPVSWLQYQFPQKKIIYKYSLSMRTNSTYYATGEPPKTWTFEGSNDGANWTILDTQTNNTTLARGVIEEYRISNSKAYTYYRVNISANQGNATITVIAELKMFEKTTVSDAGWKTISATLPSEDTFINDGMDDLSVLDRRNKGFVASMTANGSLGSGKMFKGSVDLKKYFEVTSISVK
jgi:hypothetical protein